MLALSKIRISELLAPFLQDKRFSDAELQKISTYLDLLLRWNSKINLTAVRNPEEIVTRHFGESFFAAQEVFKLLRPSSAIDLGSGAGFPGLPFKILAPDLSLTLVESNNKKAAFLREVVRLLDLAEVNVVAARAEKVELGADLVSMRAVEKFESVLPYARRLLHQNGRLALLIGNSQLEIAKSSLADLRWDEPIPIPMSKNRVLAIARSK